MDGVVAVLEALRTHQTSVAVVEPVCMLLQELADHDDVRELLVEKGATEQLVFTKGKFAPNDVCSSRGKKKERKGKKEKKETGTRKKGLDENGKDEEGCIKRKKRETIEQA